MPQLTFESNDECRSCSGPKFNQGQVQCERCYQTTILFRFDEPQRIAAFVLRGADNPDVYNALAGTPPIFLHGFAIGGWKLNVLEPGEALPNKSREGLAGFFEMLHSATCEHAKIAINERDRIVEVMFDTDRQSIQNAVIQAVWSLGKIMAGMAGALFEVQKWFCIKHIEESMKADGYNALSDDEKLKALNQWVLSPVSVIDSEMFIAEAILTYYGLNEHCTAERLDRDQPTAYEFIDWLHVKLYNETNRRRDDLKAKLIKSSYSGRPDPSHNGAREEVSEEAIADGNAADEAQRVAADLRAAGNFS